MSMSRLEPEPAHHTRQPLELARIPVGLALILVGLVMVFMAVLLWSVAPLALPERLALAAVPAYTTSVTLPTPLPLATAPLQTESWRTGVFLPESPLPAELPSLAAADLAPRLAVRPPLPDQPTRLIIPRINLDAAVTAIGLEMVENNGQSYLQWAVPNAPVVGWHDSSARVGYGSNVVLNGHHNIYGQVFRDLVALEIGDEIVVYVGDVAYRYHVSQVERLRESGEPAAVRLENARWIEPTPDERLTLITCWPYTGNSHRLVVVANPAPPLPDS